MKLCYFENVSLKCYTKTTTTSHSLTPLSSLSPKARNFAWGCLTGTIFSEVILPSFLIGVIASKVHISVPVMTDQTYQTGMTFWGTWKLEHWQNYWEEKDIHELLGIYAIIIPKCFNSDLAHLISPLSPNLMWFQGHPFVSWLQIKPFIQESYFQKDLENGGFQA